MTSTQTNADVVTDRNTVFRYDLENCPLGQKVQLLCRGGVAHYGVYTGRTMRDVYAWCPLPVRDKDEERRRGIADMGYW